MFACYVDEELLFSTTQINGREIISGSLNEEINVVSSLEFTLPPSNNMASRVYPHTSVIKLESDGVEIFRGTASSVSKNFRGDTVVSCDGMIALMADIIKEPFTVSSSGIESYVTAIVKNYNDGVAADKQIKVGHVAGFENQTFSVSHSNECKNIFELLKELRAEKGGYIWTSYIGGDVRINYTKTIGKENRQQIAFGSNLVNIEDQLEVGTLVTRVWPLGNDGLTIASINDGKAYLQNEEVELRYGRVDKTIQVDSDDPSVVKSYGQAYLTRYAAMNNTITLTAIDLHNLDKTISSFEVGDSVHVISPPHGIDAEMVVNSISTDLVQLSNSRITLGAKKGSITSVISSGGSGGSGGFTGGGGAPIVADYQARFDGKFLQIAYSYVSGGGATNSKEHYEHCAKNDYDAVKADLRLTSDNQLVCCHDAGITLNAEGRIVSYDPSNSTAIHEMTKAQFMALEFKTMYDGVRCHTCDLETFLQICKNAGKIAYITIRGEYVEATVAEMVAAVQDASMVSRTIINSFTKDALTAVRAAEPDLYLSLVIDPFTESERTTALTYAQEKKTCQICLYYSNGGHTLAEMAADSTITAWISSCIDAGIRLIGAQADAAGDTNTLLKLGCCGVQTRVSRLTNASYDGLDISTLNIATTSTDDATTLTLSDKKGNKKTAEIPKLQPTDAQVQAGVVSWMNTNAKPTVVWSKNLYNPDAAVDGYITKNGKINNSAEYWATGFIPVSPGDVLTISKAGARLNCYYRAAYTSDKTFISRESGNKNTYTVPNNAAYVRLSFKNSAAGKTDQVMVCANNTDLTYEAYGSHTEGGLGEYLVLMSANGKKWTLKVSNTGELSTQEIT